MKKNSLFLNLPDSIVIDDVHYKIKTDFRTWMKFEAIINEKIDDAYIMSSLLNKLIFINKHPSDLESAVHALFSFYELNKVHKEFKGKKSDDVLFDFNEDWDDIYSAFLNNYNIDLFEVDMHWWKFKSLFNNLKGTKFNDIMDIRGTDLSSIEDKNARKEMGYRKEYFSLTKKQEKRRKAKDIEAEILSRIGGVKND